MLEIIAQPPAKVSSVESGCGSRIAKTARREHPPGRIAADAQIRGEPLNPQEAWSRHYMTRGYGPSMAKPVGTGSLPNVHGKVEDARRGDVFVERDGFNFAKPLGRSLPLALSRKRSEGRWDLLRRLLRG